MNKTTNYQLNQWVKDDQVRMEDFNADNARIDAAIKAVDRRVDSLNRSKASVSALNSLNQTVAGKASISSLNALQTVVNGKGNCEIVMGTYTGTGQFGAEHPNTLTFTRKPMIIIFLNAPRYERIVGVRMLVRNYCELSIGEKGEYVTATWTDNSVSWICPEISIPSAEGQLNSKGKVYQYMAILA